MGAARMIERKVGSLPAVQVRKGPKERLSRQHLPSERRVRGVWKPQMCKAQVGYARELGSVFVRALCPKHVLKNCPASN